MSNKQKTTDQKPTSIDGDLTVRQQNDGILSQQSAERGIDAYPLTSGAVRLTLSRVLGYKIFGAQMERLIKQGKVIAGQDEDGNLRWSKEQLLNLADECERRKWWEPISRHRTKFGYHDQLKMGIMELEDQATAQVFNGLDNQGLIDLLLTIDGERDRNVVLCLIRGRLAALAIELDQLKNQS